MRRGVILLALLLGLGTTAQAQPVASALPVVMVQPGLLALAGVELLLPHLARAEPFPRAHAVALALVAPAVAAGAAEWDALLRPLAPVARLGAPLPVRLRAEFDAAANAAVLAEIGYPAESGRVLRLLAAAMRLGARHGGGDSPALRATVAAEDRLAEGDLSGADQALSGLDGAAALALAPWRQALARRLAADAARQGLALLVTQNLVPR